MAHFINHIIALWAWLEPAILKHPISATFWLSLVLLVVWRAMRAYVKHIARGVQPKAAPARQPQPEWRAAISELHNRMDDLAHARLVGDGSPFPDAATLRPGMVLIWNGRAWVGHPTVMAGHSPQNPQGEPRTIQRQSRGRGKKATVQIDQPPTAWERITEEPDGGPDKPDAT